jgi:hypothetical protein
VWVIDFLCELLLLAVCELSTFCELLLLAVCELSTLCEFYFSPCVNYRLSVRIITSRRVWIIDFPCESLLLAVCELSSFCASYYFSPYAHTKRKSMRIQQLSTFGFTKLSSGAYLMIGTPKIQMKKTTPQTDEQTRKKSFKRLQNALWPPAQTVYLCFSCSIIRRSVVA